MQISPNQVAVITGAASGIGAALAHACVNRNIKVVLADINADNLVKLQNELATESSNILTVVTDVSSKSDIQLLAQKTISTFGKVNFLFNNAGIAGPLGKIWEIDEDKLMQTIQINLLSIIYSLREFLPLMLSQQEESYVINTASGAGLHTGSNMSGYMATKHAVVALSEVLYFDLAESKANVHVSVLCPGLVNTNLTNSINIKSDASKEIKEMASFFQKAIKEGMSADDVAEQVFAAIAENKFYILTHFKEHEALIRHRFEGILQQISPKQ